MSTARYLDHPYLLAGRRIDPITGTLSYRDVQKHLRRKELQVLALLAEAGDGVVSRSTFIEQIWHGNPVGEQGLTDTMSALRRSLLDTDRENPLILTIPRRGYQLRASIRLISRDDGVAFVAGSVIDGRPDWRLKLLLQQTDAHESWLAEDGRSRRVFRFCCNELQLRKLRREIVLMRYLREALADQDHISTILDWRLDEPPYFLELAAPVCGNLRGVMLGKDAPEPAERWKLLQQVAEALSAVHAAGIVHRNLTPDSILIDRRDGERVALLGEFGSAVLDDRQRLIELGIDPGELSLQTQQLDEATVYVAPECVAGTPATAASDVYALGAVIVQTVCGDFQRLEFSDVEGLSAEAIALLQRCSAVDPLQRPTAAELAAALRAMMAAPKPAPWAIEPPPVAPVESPSIPSSPAPAALPATEAAPVPAASVTAKPIPPAPVVATEPVPGAPVAPAPQMQERIGRYRLLDEIAQGGMGVVYLAEQSEPVQRRVALKLIRAGLDSAQILARFEAERRALALMNHPNISAIFDAGTTPGGHPYFVMEYVPGKDIKSHCDDGRLDLRARIRLFLQVCDGVLHAHQKGLIHRDLKPKNILVKQKSEQPALVKLIDFGVAKSLTGALGPGLHTRLGSFVGTPVYSSPEQVTDPTRDIDTRADLYSLGVVLYEILTGVPPRSAQELEADTPAELARRLRDSRTPPMGSRYAALSPEDQHRIAELRALSADGLSMQLCSDLDWIVGKCIAQDPDDRYATVQDLRLDLQRWLDDRPVEARPANAWYRFRKMLRRNRWSAAVIAGGALCLMASTTAAVFGYLRAEAALQESNAVVDLQIRQMLAISPQNMGIGLREALEERIRGDAGLTEAERLQAQRALAAVNTTDLATGMIVDHLVMPSLTTIRAEFSGRLELKLKLMRSQAEILQSLDRNSDALAMASALLEESRAALGDFHEQTLGAMIFKGSVLSKLSRAADAEAILGEAIASAESHYGPRHLAVGQARAALCERYGKGTTDAAAAIRTCESAIAILSDALGAMHRDTVQVAIDLVKLHFNFGTVENAKAQLARLNDLDLQDPELQIQLLYLNGFVAFQEGQGDDAVQRMTKAVEIARQRFGMNHSITLNMESSLGVIYNNLSEFELARPLLTRSFEANRKSLGIRNENTIVKAYSLASLLFDIGLPIEAMQLLDQIPLDTLSNLTALFPLFDEVRILRSQLEQDFGDRRRAVLELQQVVDHRQNQLGAKDPATLYARARLAHAMEVAGPVDAAMAAYAGLLDDVASVESSGVSLPRGFYIKGVQGRYLRLRGDPVGSERLLRETLDAASADVKRQLAHVQSDMLFAMGEWCESALANGAASAAESICVRALNLARDIRHPDDDLIVRELDRAGRAHLAAGNLGEARILLDEASKRLEGAQPLATRYGASVSQALLELGKRPALTTPS